MMKHCFRLLIITFIILLTSPSFAAVLRWSPVESTAECTIAGYKVHYGTSTGQMNTEIDVGNVTSYNLDLLTLTPGTTYYFAVSAYSTTNIDGPSSLPIPYTVTLPGVSGFPVINFTNNTIDITFNKSDMIGAATKNNYEFNPTLLFDDTRNILRINTTYRLYMDYIPERTIFTVTLSNITDAKGQSLVSNSLTINDNDNDLMADDWESFYGVSSAFLDNDSDGLYNRLEYTTGTDPTDEDSDDDGMDDGWEVENDLNPLFDDAGEDADNDGLTNLEEYNGGTIATNKSPEKPLLSLPADGSSDVALIPQLKTGSYVDYENDAHAKTQWQVSTNEEFDRPEAILFEIETYEGLTILNVPEFIVDPGKTYFWRVRFFDIHGGASIWSDPFSFNTLAVSPEDKDENGVPDVQQVTDGTIDLDGDGYLDIISSTYKMINYGSSGISLEASRNVRSIDGFKSIDPDDIAETFGKPQELPLGMLQFKITTSNPGDTAEVYLYFSEPVGNRWYKYDQVNGWTEYSKDFPGNVLFSSGGTSVLLRLVDGGPGDSDGVANGIIVDPSGPGAAAAAIPGGSGSGSSSGGGGDSGGGGCFIATAAFGSPVEKHVQVLKDFRDMYLLKSMLGTAFVKAYYKYSPPIADKIAQSEALRSVVRVTLMPLIAFGYATVHTSPFQKTVLLFLLLSCSIMMANRIKKQKFIGQKNRYLRNRRLFYCLYYRYHS